MRQSNPPLIVIMPLAGKGERFRRCAYDQPKPLVNVLGRPLVLRVIESLGLSATDSLIIVYHNSLRETCLESLIRQAFPHFQISFRCLANRTRGAAETVLFGLDTLPDDALDAPIIIADGDGIVHPGVLDSFRASPGNTIFCFDDTGDDPIYSYVETDANLNILSIAEKIAISSLACIGIYGIATGQLLRSALTWALEASDPDGNEIYMSHVVQVLLDQGQGVQAERVDGWACLGTPKQLQMWCRRQWLLQQLGRKHAAFYEVARFPTWKLDPAERQSVERESGFYLPVEVPSRPWNKLEFSIDTVMKTGPSDQLGYELQWYKSLPKSLSRYVPALKSHRRYGTSTTLNLDRIRGVPFCHLLLDDLLTDAELGLLMQVLTDFHTADLADMDSIPEGATIYDNYGPKISERFTAIHALAGASECFTAIMAQADDYRTANRGRKAVIHGDPVFTNVILTPDEEVVLVDPRGHLNGQATILGDANYDLAKIYQSLMGYDAIVLGHQPRAGANRLLVAYEERLSDLIGIRGIADIRWITASLYLSLLPLHEVRHRQAFLNISRSLLDI